MCFYMHLVPRKIPQLCSGFRFPNITGYAVQGIDYYFHDNYHGALKAYAYGSDGWQLTNHKGPATTKYEINASLANSIYSSESMQPKAFQALIIIKI